MDKPLDIPGLADFLGKSVSWVQKEVAARRIPHTRIGRQVRFTQAHVAEILAAGEQRPLTTPVVAIRTPRRRRAA